MNQFRKDTAKILGALSTVCWVILGAALLSFAAGYACHLCIKAFRLGWGVW